MGSAHKGLAECSMQGLCWKSAQRQRFKCKLVVVVVVMREWRAKKINVVLLSEDFSSLCFILVQLAEVRVPAGCFLVFCSLHACMQCRETCPCLPFKGSHTHATMAYCVVAHCLHTQYTLPFDVTPSSLLV